MNMATKSELQEKTVAELREMAVKQDLQGRSALTTKDEFVNALATGPSDEQKQAKARESGATDDYSETSGSVKIIGQAASGKNETRLFQTAPDRKEYLTKQQAKDHGFFWKD